MSGPAGSDERPELPEQSGQHRTAADAPLPGGDFSLFLTRLSLQGMMSLGILENPLTGKSQRNLGQARMILDDLQMLRDKTHGNLSEDEARHLAKVIGDLERQYMRVERGGK